MVPGQDASNYRICRGMDMLKLVQSPMHLRDATGVVVVPVVASVGGSSTAGYSQHWAIEFSGSQNPVLPQRLPRVALPYLSTRPQLNPQSKPRQRIQRASTLTL